MMLFEFYLYVFFFKQKTAYEMRISDWSSDVCLPICYLVAVVSGYILHSTWSFRGHGAAATQTSWRFFLVSLVSYAMNAFWVWLLTDDAILAGPWWRSEEHTSELQSLMRISYAVFCLKKKKKQLSNIPQNTILPMNKEHREIINKNSRKLVQNNYKHNKHLTTE